MPVPHRSLASLLRGGRDRLTGGGLRTLLNMKLERYAYVDKLELDSTTKSLRLELRLRGEEDRPVELSVDGYELFLREGCQFIRVHEARCNRPWLDHLLEDFLLGREIEVPAKVAPVVRAVL